MTATNGDFIDANLFLNANPNQQQAESNCPIITTPSSPLDDANKNGRTASLTGTLVQPTSTSTIQLTAADVHPSIPLNPVDGAEDLTGSQELMKRTLR